MLDIFAIYTAQARTWLQCNVDSVYVESVCRQIYQWLCWTFQSKFKRFFCFWQWHFAFIVNRYHLLYSLAYCCCCRCCSRCCCRWCSLDSVNCCFSRVHVYIYTVCVFVCVLSSFLFKRTSCSSAFYLTSSQSLEEFCYISCICCCCFSSLFVSSFSLFRSLFLSFLGTGICMRLNIKN